MRLTATDAKCLRLAALRRGARPRVAAFRIAALRGCRLFARCLEKAHNCGSDDLEGDACCLIANSARASFIRADENPSLRVADFLGFGLRMSKMPYLSIRID